MKTAFDIIRLTPKTNCGECGFETCIVFAVSVIGGNCKVGLCPYIKDKAHGVNNERAGIAGEISPDTALLKELKSKVKSADLAKRADGLGAEAIEEGGQTALKLPYLGSEVTISAKGAKDLNGHELDPRDQILLYNYIFFGGSGPLTGQWIGLESLPNSISKVVTLRRYAEDKLAEAFGGNIEGLRKAAGRLSASLIDPCHADLCLIVPVLPKVPVQLHFWDQDTEEGFGPRVKALFDRRVLDFLDIESLIFASERTAEAIIAQTS
ncbi:MAG: DUF3786 domain-containing protein [Desulfobacteraceae bacterium]|nr:DUF3786 domain-containing protein [Desulfobacteraceae bacterium]